MANHSLAPQIPRLIVVEIPYISRRIRRACKPMKKSSSEMESGIILTKISYIENDVRELKEMMSSGYVTKQEFEPVKRIVYGLVSLILAGWLGAILALIYK